MQHVQMTVRVAAKIIALDAATAVRTIVRDAPEHVRGTVPDATSGSMIFRICSSEICFPFCGMILKSYSCVAYFFSDPPICSAVLLIITFFTFSLIRFKDSAVMILILLLYC